MKSLSVLIASLALSTAADMQSLFSSIGLGLRGGGGPRPRTTRALDETSTSTNLALNGLATGSSECGGGSYAYNAIDGDDNTNFFSCKDDERGEVGSEWLMVDLGKDTLSEIEKIVIRNRNDCSGGKLKDYNITILDGEKNVVAYKEVNDKAETGEVLTFYFDDRDEPVIGRFARIQYYDGKTNRLVIAELEVWGKMVQTRPTTLPSIVELAENKPATASTTNKNNEQAWRANDGNLGTFFTSKQEINPWLEIDLGATSFVERIEIVSLVEGANHRLEEAIVQILDADKTVVDTRLLPRQVDDGDTVMSVFNDDNSLARYVKVSMDKGTHRLHMAEIFVYGYYTDEEYDARVIPLALENVALDKPTAQTCEFKPQKFHNEACFANNGIVSAEEHTHTCSVADAWWIVDLEEEHIIYGVNITNRVANGGQRLRDFYVTFLDEDANEVFSVYNDYSVENGGVVDIPVREDGVAARFVKVQLSGEDERPLHLAEVEVFGIPAENSSPDSTIPPALDSVFWTKPLPDGGCLDLTPRPQLPYTCKASAFGDPHIKTFDRFRYDAQAKGEAIMLKSLNEASALQVQGRFVGTSNKFPWSPAITTGLAIQGSDPEQPTITVSMTSNLDYGVEMNECQVALFVDGVLQDGLSYDSTETGGPSVTFEYGEKKDKIKILYPDDLLVEMMVKDFNRRTNAKRCLFNSNVHLLDCGSVKDDIVGLLGSPNGDKSDDWMEHDGTPIDIPEGSKKVIFEPSFEYSKTWIIQDEESSIFSYEPDKSFDDYFVPDEQYNDEYEKTIMEENPEVDAICGDDIQCRIDGIAIGVEAADDYVHNPVTARTVEFEVDDLDDDSLCLEEL